MVAVYDPNLRITEQGTGDNPNTWGAVLNQQVFALLSNAIAGVTQIDFSAGANIDISTAALVPPNDFPGVANGATDTARNMVLELTDVTLPITSGLTLTLPALEKVYIIRAAQTGGFPINVMCKGGSTSIAFNLGMMALVYTNGTNIFALDANGLLESANNLSDLANAATARTNLGLGSAAVLTAGTAANNAVQLNSSGKLPAVDGSLLTNVTGTPTGVGTAAFLNVGTAAGNVVQLNGSGQLPAVDGSLLTNLPNQAASTSSGFVNKVVIGSVTIQTGFSPLSAGANPSIVFPTQFSAAPVVTFGPGAFAQGVWLNGAPTVTGFSTHTAPTDEQGSPSATPFYWTAIGTT